MMREVPLRLRRIAWGGWDGCDPDSDARRKRDQIFYSCPPNPPKDRVQLLRRAFCDTMNDAEFLAVAKKGNLAVGPVAGEYLEKIENSLFKVDPATVNKLRELPSVSA